MNEQISEIKSNSSDNPILDIVNSIQNKLNENNNTQTSEKNNLNGLDISKMLDMLNISSKSSNNTQSAPSTPGINLDLNTIMNFQKVLGGMNQSDPRRDLLTSLKPFLRETRQKNIDTYITLLGVMKAFNIFTNKDRD